MTFSPIQPDSVITSKEQKANPHLIIAGPCSAESEEQVLQTARGLLSSGVSYFRAGIWKPRTKPNSFAGVGAPALEWLKTLKKETGMLLATEVANARHVEAALNAGVDLLWLGARTSVNPFTVQEISDALKGVKVAVMIKNPINPDPDLWAGATERIQLAGVSKIIACHRGFNVFGNTTLRNTPLWEIPIDYKRKFPEIPLICDPSHIAGRRDFLKGIAQKALNLGFEGLMIETHINPSAALSDADQQITPAELIAMLKELQFKTLSTDNTDYHNRVRFLRAEIDDVDDRLLELLADRMDITRKIGLLKDENNLSFYQYDRWAEILENSLRNCDKLSLRKDFIKKIFSLIHLESIDIQGE